MGMKLEVFKENGVYWIRNVYTGVVDYKSYASKVLATKVCKQLMRYDLPLISR